jgi:PAS domain S-box-containing protein
MLNILIGGAGSTRDDAQRVLSQTVEFAANGVALTAADGSILLTNAELQRMFGYAGTELRHKSIEQLLPERFRGRHASLREGECKDTQLSSTARELCGRRADGTEFPIEISLSVLETSDGAVVVETIVDVSVRERLERIFQCLVEAAPCGMVMIEPRGRIVLVNPLMETMSGYTRAELIGAPLEMLLPERFRATHGSYRHAFIASPSKRQMGVGRDLAARRKDGSEFPVEIGLNPVPGEESGLVLVAVSDITRRKSMEFELRQAYGSLEELKYAVFHGLRSPMRGIADLVEWIEEDLGKSVSPEAARNFGRFNERMLRLEQNLDDLLMYARADTTPVEAVGVDPEVLVAEILETQPVPPDFRIAVHVDAAPFVTSKKPLASALRNLISNAIQHHDLPSGNVDIRVEEVDRYYVFTVSDDGPGIPLVAQERVFRMFRTLAPLGRAGSGVGLALSRRLVEAHGGKITLTSTDDVRGATFRIWWPRYF